MTTLADKTSKKLMRACNRIAIMLENVEATNLKCTSEDAFAIRQALNSLSSIFEGNQKHMESIVEWCAECDTEVELLAEPMMQACPNCGKVIAPCNYCMDTNGDIPCDWGKATGCRLSRGEMK